LTEEKKTIKQAQNAQKTGRYIYCQNLGQGSKGRGKGAGCADKPKLNFARGNSASEAWGNWLGPPAPLDKEKTKERRYQNLTRTITKGRKTSETGSVPILCLGERKIKESRG